MFREIMAAGREAQQREGWPRAFIGVMVLILLDIVTKPWRMEE